MSFHIGYINTFNDAEMLLQYMLFNNLMCETYAVNRLNILRNLDYVVNAAQDSQPLGAWAFLNNLMYNPDIQYRMWQIQQFEYTVSTCQDIQLLIQIAQYAGLNDNSLLQRKLRANASHIQAVEASHHGQNMDTGIYTDYLPTPAVFEPSNTTDDGREAADIVDVNDIDDLLAFVDSLPQVSNHPKNIYTCNHCSDVFIEKHLLRQHTSKYHKIIYGCTYCATVFTSQQEVKQHTLDVHIDIPKTNQYGGAAVKKLQNGATSKKLQNDAPSEKTQDGSTSKKTQEASTSKKTQSDDIASPPQRKRQRLNSQQDTQTAEEAVEAYFIHKRHDKIF
jgi:hypothetical protein